MVGEAASLFQTPNGSLLMEDGGSVQTEHEEKGCGSLETLMPTDPTAVFVCFETKLGNSSNEC